MIYKRNKTLLDIIIKLASNTAGLTFKLISLVALNILAWLTITYYNLDVLWSGIVISLAFILWFKPLREILFRFSSMIIVVALILFGLHAVF